jgi:hypothetical protein
MKLIDYTHIFLFFEMINTLPCLDDLILLESDLAFTISKPVLTGFNKKCEKKKNWLVFDTNFKFQILRENQKLSDFSDLSFNFIGFYLKF